MPEMEIQLLSRQESLWPHTVGSKCHTHCRTAMTNRAYLLEGSFIPCFSGVTLGRDWACRCGTKLDQKVLLLRSMRRNKKIRFLSSLLKTLEVKHCFPVQCNKNDSSFKSFVLSLFVTSPVCSIIQWPKGPNSVCSSSKARGLLCWPREESFIHR